MTTQTIKLTDIILDKGTQLRRQHCDDAIEEYAARYAAGLPMPPIEIVFDGAEHFLVDGFHRYWAAQKAGLMELEATVETGNVRQAILKACGANAAHGMRRTAADKRRAVVTLLYDASWREWSDRAIATACNVSPTTVGAIRASIASTVQMDGPPETRMGADGKRRRLPRAAPPEEDVNDLLSDPDEGETMPTSREFPVAPREDHAVVVRCPDHAHAVQVLQALQSVGYDCYVWENEQ